MIMCSSLSDPVDSARFDGQLTSEDVPSPRDGRRMPFSAAELRGGPVAERSNESHLKPSPHFCAGRDRSAQRSFFS